MTTKKKKAYRIDKEKMLIIIDDEVKLTEQDKEDIKFYVSCGYEIKHKSAKKAKKAKENADKKKKYTKEYIEGQLKGQDLKDFIAIKNGKGKGLGWFAAQSWYIKKFVENKEVAEA